jgi:hypothetical protein
MDSNPLVFGDYMGVASIDWNVFDPMFCKVCVCQLNGREQAEFHYRGKKHVKRAKIARLRECKLGARIL